MWDRVKSETIRHGLNLYIRGKYGEITSLDWNGRVRSLRLEILLTGEVAPVEVIVERYEVVVDGKGRTGIVCTGVQVSRAWMHELARTQVEARPIRIPESLVGIVQAMLG